MQDELALLVAAHLDGSLDRNGQQRLSELVADPAAMHAARSQVRMAVLLAGLRSQAPGLEGRVQDLIRASRPSQRRIVATALPRRAKRTLLAVRLLAAAGFLIVLGVLLFPRPTSPASAVLANDHAPTLRRLGSELATGSQIGPEAQAISLSVAGGSLNIAPNGVLVVKDRTTHMLHLELERGSISCAWPDQGQRNVSIATGFGEVSIAGTKFTLDRHMTGCAITVTEGAVNCTTRSGQSALLGAGHDGWLDDQASFSHAPAMRMPIDGPSRSSPSGWDRSRVRWSRDEKMGPMGQPAISVHLSARGWVTYYRDRRPADWRAFDGMRLWLHGDGSNAEIGIEVADNAAPGPDDRMERFVHSLRIDWRGWRLLRIPFAAFVRRTPQASRHAPDDGFGRDQVHGWSLFAGTQSVQLRIAEPGLY